MNVGFGGGMGMSVNLGGGGFNNYGGGFNNYGGGSGFNNMGTFSYNGTWNTGNDQMLRSQIDRVYMQYDYNRTGQLEGQ